MGLIKTEDVKTIWYDKKKTPFPVYLIPLKDLIYNKHNGRIKSIVTSFESGLGRKLDAKNPEDANIIETFLYDSAESRNEKTIQSLRDYGQQEIGIVTNDMIIIDGNRRASLLNRINREDRTSESFKAIILPDNLSTNKLEIIKLETNYQMGVDNKVEYKPIEKYLRCKELIHEYGLDVAEVAKLMSETTTRILQWLDILLLMEEYLVYLSSPNVYTRLDKTEGHFVDLHSYIKKYYKQAKANVDELKTTYFDYIRLGLPVQRLRVLGNPNNSMSLFAREEYWNNFFATHLDIKSKYSEDNFKKIKLNHPTKSNEEIFTKIDNDYKETLSDGLQSNLVAGEIYIKSVHERNTVIGELKRMDSYLTTIVITQNILNVKDEIKRLLSSISSSADNLKGKI